MKTITLTCILLLAYAHVRSQVNHPSAGINRPAVDERIELLSIAARLAGYDEYNTDLNKLYVDDIHQYFDRYKDHPLIKFMREIRDRNGIGFDAVATMAIHLSSPPWLEPVVKFNDEVPDKRWGLKTALKFDSLLKQFYSDTRFHNFFKSQQRIYKVAVAQFDSLYKKLDLGWYDKYYGIKPRGSFNIIIGMGNGGANYGPKVLFPDGREQLYAIMGTWNFNKLGVPSFNDRDYLPILIHEFNHSFVNYLTEENKGKLQASGNIIYQAVGKKMKRLAYSTWQTMMSEALVRASVIRYLKTHENDSTIAIKELQTQRSLGFIWIKQLVDFLGEYESNRKTYPTLEKFMPRIIDFYSTVSVDITDMLKEYASKQAHVLSMEPAINGDTIVQPGLKQLKIYFDKPLTGKGVSINYGKLGKTHYPGIKMLGYTDDNKAILLEVGLKPNTEYDFALTGLAFKTPDGYPLETYEVTFKTK